jgi:hypothetical protein
MAAFLSLLYLPHLVREIARQVCRGLYRARTVPARDLHPVRVVVLLLPDEIVRRV